MIPEKIQGSYCSEKFTWLSVDLEKHQAFSCCAATPQQIDITWLKNNPGELFNIPVLQKERQSMLDGNFVSSCEGPCWNPERQGLTSRRMLFPTQEKQFITTQVTIPQNLHIMLGSTCNMTCSYCCKNYSSAWLRDIEDNGPYLQHDRYTIYPIDRILSNISQKEHQNSYRYQMLFEEIGKLQTTDSVFISGGETFLHNNLVELVNKLTINNRVSIYTGMGVDPKRFQTQLGKLINRDQITLIVSAENCGDFYEFNRFGNAWNNFEINLSEIKTQNFDWYFSSVISNLTIFGFCEFAKRFKAHRIKYEFCGDPEFLNINVIDEQSKEILSDELNNSEIQFRDTLIRSMMQPSTTQQHRNLSLYLTQFSQRRNLDLTIYPYSFIRWIQNVH